MRKVCVVTNYNYDKYLPFCLNSLVKQSVRFDVIYVVDDGSTDKSKSIIQEYAKSFQEIVPLFKDNAGQLSCFNFAREYITDDDLVWFIDSDDYYPPDYVELFLIATKGSTSDFFFCKTVKFYTEDTIPKTALLESKPAIDIELSIQMTRLAKCWIGGPTSAIVVSGSLYNNIFPYPYESQWKTCADEILVFASSLGGYSKTFLPSLGFGYRVHDSNKEYGRIFNRGYKKNKIKKRNALLAWYTHKYVFNKKIEFKNVIDEYNSISSTDYSKSININMIRLFKKHLIHKLFSVPNIILNKWSKFKWRSSWAK